MSVLACCGACGPAQVGKHQTAPNTSHSGTISIVIDSQMTDTFHLEAWELFIDDQKVASCAASGTAPVPIAPVVAYEGFLPRGDHSVGVTFRHRGHGEGVFAYLQGYRFKARSSHEAVIGPTGFLTLRVVACERGGATAPLEQRPTVCFEAGTEVPDSRLPRGCRGDPRSP